MLADRVKNRVRMGGMRTKVLLYDRGMGEENWEHYPNRSSTAAGSSVEHVYNDTFLQILTNFPDFGSFDAGFYTVLNMTNYNYVYVEMESVAEYGYTIYIWAGSDLMGSSIYAEAYEYIEGEITMTLDISDVIGEKYLMIQPDPGVLSDPMELKIYKVWVE